MPRTLTLETLKSKKACRSQVELFQQLFGDSVEITPELCIKYAKRFDVGWAARNLLSNAAYEKYCAETKQILGEYYKGMEDSYNIYNDKIQNIEDKNSNDAKLLYIEYVKEAKSSDNEWINKENVAWNKYCAEKTLLLKRRNAKMMVETNIYNDEIKVILDRYIIKISPILAAAYINDCVVS